METNTDWRNKFFNFKMCKGAIEQKVENGNIVVTGNLKPSLNQNAMVMFWAANPPHRNGSFSGSGLPYPNAEMAFDRSVNVGAVKAVNGNFSFELQYPSAYYGGLGSLYIPPQVHIKVCESGNKNYDTLVLGQGMPYRSLTYPSPPGKRSRTSPLFYASKLPIRGQEAILRSAAYPKINYIPDNFWGLKPPN
jgi:hypothetical protein